VLRSATQGTRLRFQCDLCSAACTKSGHANLHDCYPCLDDQRKRKDSRRSGQYLLQTFVQLQPTGLIVISQIGSSPSHLVTNANTLFHPQKMMETRLGLNSTMTTVESRAASASDRRCTGVERVLRAFSSPRAV